MRQGRTEPGGICLRPWAKVNLYLKITGRSSDGYHELSTYIHPIKLFDELVIRRGEGLTVRCTAEDLPDGQIVPDGKDNLVTRAAILFFQKIEKKPSVEIKLTKRIPVGGGLGGGSSDAANTLLGLNRLFGYPLGQGTLYKICAELGTDVPFFLEPRPAVCTGRGEIIKKRSENLNFFCILANPGRVLSTKAVYERFNLTLTPSQTKDNISVFQKRIDIDRIIEHIYNDLENPAIQLCPEIKDIMDIFRKAGAVRSFVCGSGATVCGLAKDEKEAWEVMQRFKEEGDKNWWVRVAGSIGC